MVDRWILVVILTQLEITRSRVKVTRAGMRVDGRDRCFWMISSFLKKVRHDLTWRDQSVWFGCAKLKLEATAVMEKFLLNLVLHRYCFQAQTILSFIVRHHLCQYKSAQRLQLRRKSKEPRPGYSREPGIIGSSRDQVNAPFCSVSCSLPSPTASASFLRRNQSSTTMTTTTDSDQPLPPFKTLPPDLHLSIASHLLFQDIYALRQTNHYFYDLLPPLRDIPLIGRDRQYALEAQLVELERSFFGRSNGLLYCGGCFKLRHRKHFVRFMSEGRPRAKLGFNGFWKCLDCQRDAFGNSQRRAW